MFRRFLGLFAVFISFQLQAQDGSVKIIEASEIPIDTTTVVYAETTLIDVDDSIQVIEVKESVTIDPDFYNITIPIVNLQDDPSLSLIDAKWMQLVSDHERYSTRDLSGTDLGYVTNGLDFNITTEELKLRLKALNDKTPFHIEYNPILEDLIKRFLKSRAKVMSGLMAKATFYFPLFEEKLDLYDVPLEMKYLAIVESALRPKAKSPVGATGLWQFMYGTGKMYGLEVSSYIDERQDPVRSTEAAARHLSDLYDVFEDWDLALAAYNSGSGNVTKAIRRAGGKRNYWNLRHYLPRETANYVPIFYATLYLFEYGASHGLYPDDSMQYQLYEIDSLQVKKTITFEQIQKATGIDISLLEFLNPSYKLDIIPYSSDKPNYMVLPREYIGLFVQNEDLIYAYVEQENAKREKPLPENLKVNPNAIVYRVKSGDYLGKIAERYGVSVRSIMRWNGLKSSRLRVGQKLKIYSRRAPSSTSSKKSKKVSNPPQGSLIYYTVQNGDTLWDIAQKYSNVSVDDIKKWNNLTSHNLKVGSKLKIYKS